MLRLLLQAGADPNAQSDDGWTPLMFAGDDDVTAVQILLEYGARAQRADRAAQTRRAAVHLAPQDG